LREYTLNQLFRSLCLFSGFRSPWSLSNKDDKTENGAVSLFCGGGGKLRSTSVDATLIGVGYEGWGSAEDMAAADKTHIPKARNDFGWEARLDARDKYSGSHLISGCFAPWLGLRLNFAVGFSTAFTLSPRHTDYESAGGFLYRPVQTMATEDPFNSLQRRKTHDPSMIGLWKIGRTIGKGSSGLFTAPLKRFLY